MTKNLTLVLLVATMFIWGVNFHMAKVALEFYSPMGVAFWRFAFGVIVLIVLLVILKGKALKRIKLSAKQLFYTFLTSFFGIFLTIYFFNMGLKTASAVNGSLILATSPMMTAVLAAIFLYRKFTPLQIIAILMSTSGVAVILVSGDLQQLLSLKFETGDLYILYMAFVFSLSQIIVNKYLLDLDPILMTTVGSIMGLVMFAVISFPELNATPIPTDATFWVSVLFMGILGTGIAYAAFYHAVVELGATTTALYGNLIPFFTVGVAIFIGEALNGAQIVGGLIVIIGLFLFGYRRKKYY